MANKALFKSIVGKFLPRTNTRNAELAPAYAFEPRHALAQYAATGCLNATFYASAAEQLDVLLELAWQVDPTFVAKTALYARTRGFMKDMPAFLLAVLSMRDPSLCAAVFPRVIDTPKMLRNFVQIIRSGVTGRKSLGSMPKRLVRQWLESRSDVALFVGSVGNDPSLADIIKMVHPTPADNAREALYGYLIGREHDASLLPPLVRQFEAFKAAGGRDVPVPDVPFQMLTALPLGTDAWTAIALGASWQTTRMNLNTFARHGVLADKNVVDTLADRLADPAQIRKARALPYQLLVAYCTAEVPAKLSAALQDAMEIATANVPVLPGEVYVCPDVSGSMSAPVTGHRAGATTAVRCIDVAALVAASVLRRNAQAQVLPFEQSVVGVKLNPRDSVMTNARRLARIGGGGTNCSAPLALINKRQAPVDTVIYVSDNESWVDAVRVGDASAMMREWNIVKKRCPQAKLVCIDLVPNRTTQAASRRDILNVGGFSDAVFEVVARFLAADFDRNYWVDLIEAEVL